VTPVLWQQEFEETTTDSAFQPSQPDACYYIPLERSHTFLAALSPACSQEEGFVNSAAGDRRSERVQHISYNKPAAGHLPAVGCWSHDSSTLEGGGVMKHNFKAF
jgi:hypothetical protein